MKRGHKMPIIRHKQFIRAPIKECFDFARNVDIHIKTTSKTKEKAVGGVKESLIYVFKCI